MLRVLTGQLHQAAIREENATERRTLFEGTCFSIKKLSTNCRLRTTRNLYPVSNSFVLMFVPTKSGYSAALKTDPSYFGNTLIVSILSFWVQAIFSWILQWTHDVANFYDKECRGYPSINQTNSSISSSPCRDFRKIRCRHRNAYSRIFNRAKGQPNEGKGK